MKLRWQKLTDEFIGKKEYFLIDASVYSFFTILKEQIDKYVKGKVLDAGAGRLALEFILNKKAQHYYSIDKYLAREELSIIGDLSDSPIKENSFDTIICIQVIEHSSTPQAIIRNLSSSLKKGGKLILSAPHISYLHGEPEDYYRFTKYGLAYLVETCGLKVLEINAAGSLFGYLFSIISNIILCYTYKIPVIFPVIFFFNSLFIRLVSKIDIFLFKNSIVPINYILTAEKIV